MPNKAWTWRFYCWKMEKNKNSSTILEGPSISPRKNKNKPPPKNNPRLQKVVK